MPDIIPALIRREEFERRSHEGDDVIEGAWSRGPEKRFQFGECLFDRIEIGTVGREKADLRADRFDRRAYVRLFVHREVIEHDHITGS